MLGEGVMALTMFLGNIMTMKYLGDAGVGAFGLICYYLPFVFLVGNSIAQEAQPIISFNYGYGDFKDGDNQWVDNGCVVYVWEIPADRYFPSG